MLVTWRGSVLQQSRSSSQRPFHSDAHRLLDRRDGNGITGVSGVSTNQPVAIIGLTGGIATGKSTVSGMLSDLGAFVIDADAVAREIVEPGEPALAEIAAVFGEEVIGDDGRLDRGALGDVIFGEADARERLNKITHPRIARRMMQTARHAGEQGFRWVVYDAALIVENNIHPALAGLIVVTCEPETQLRRLIERDDLSESDARARVDSQMPLARKVEVADWVVDNDGPLERTRQQVRELFDDLTDEVGPARLEPET